MKLVGKNIILTKLTDDMFNGNHPNGIHVGYKLKGYVKKEPKITKQFYLYSNIKGMEYPCNWTSAVKRIDFENMLLKTENSTYKIEIVS